MSIKEIIEIITLITGVIYIILELGQKNAMWLVGIVTSLAAMYVFAVEKLWASLGLNTYYFLISFWGLYQWRKDKKKLENDAEIHLNKLSASIIVKSLIFLIIGTFGLSFLMKYLENPQSYLDSFIAILSAIATWWLTKAYLEQWLLWLVADSLLALMCIIQGLPWLALLYFLYAVAAAYGYYHWRKKGVYLYS